MIDAYAAIPSSGFRPGYLIISVLEIFILILITSGFTALFVKVQAAFGAWRDNNGFLWMEDQHGNWYEWRRFGQVLWNDDLELYELYLKKQVKRRDKNDAVFLTVMSELSGDQLEQSPFCPFTWESNLVEHLFWVYVMAVALMKVDHPEETTLRRRPPPDFASKVRKLIAIMLVMLLIGIVILIVWFVRARRYPSEYPGTPQWRLVYYPDEERKEQAMLVEYYDLTIDPTTRKRIQVGKAKKEFVNYAAFQELDDSDGESIEISDISYTKKGKKGRPFTKKVKFASALQSIGFASSPRMVAQNLTQRIVDMKGYIRKLRKQFHEQIRKNAITAHLGTSEFRELAEFVLRTALLNRLKIIDVFSRMFGKESEEQFWASLAAWVAPQDSTSPTDLLVMQINAMQQAGLALPPHLEGAAQQLQLAHASRPPRPPDAKKSRWGMFKRQKKEEPEAVYQKDDSEHKEPHEGEGEWVYITKRAT